MDGYVVWGCGEYTVSYCCDGDTDCPNNPRGPDIDGARLDVSEGMRLCVPDNGIKAIPCWLMTEA